MRVHPLAQAAVLCVLSSAPAFAIDAAIFGNGAQCVAGSCTTGEGTIRAQDGTEYSGTWQAGRHTEGKTYRVRSRLQPERVTEIEMHGDGTPIRGTVLRGDPSSGKGVVGEFSGSFTQVHNPFTNARMSSYSVGKYTDRKLGMSYEGEFSYVPARSGGVVSGYMIFQGARIDDESDEVVRGLFVSERSFPGHPILFRKARPDYLVKLQTDFEAEQAGAAAQARAAEDTQRAGENMASLLGVMGGLMSLSGGGSRLGSLQSNSLAGLTGALTGKQSSGDILKGVLSQVAQQAGADPSLARALGGATSASTLIGSLSGLGKSSQPMTRAQYAAQMLAAVATRGGAGEAATAAPAASLTNTPTDAPGTVQLVYTPGKGFLDTAAGRYVKTIEEMSCDNLTTRGQKLRDLPPAQRTCMEPGRSSASTSSP